MGGTAKGHNGVASDGNLDVSATESGPLDGRRGLRNMGNTCFMNAGLQCIAHIEPLAQYFLQRSFEKDSSLQLEQGKSSSTGVTNSGSKGELTNSFTALLQELWHGNAKKSGQQSKNILPKRFHNTFKKLRPFLFEDEEQQDVQEFIGFCLEGLNEDLNRVAQVPSNPTDVQMQEDERLGNEQGDDFAAALSWYRHLEREKSFLIDLLQGQQRSSVTCQQCGYMSRKFEPFMHISIPVEKTMSCITDGISKYLEEEDLSGDEQWYCEKCKTKVDAKKKIELWFLPPVLILHLKRFDASLTKIDKRLHMNVNGFDLSTCCSKPQKDGAVYDVSCVANHQGAYGSGHYTATCRVGSPSSGTWHRYDDEDVSELKDSRGVATKQAYVVFLVRQGREDLVASGAKKRTAPPPDPKTQALWRRRMLLRCQSVTNPADWPHALGPAAKAREAAAQVGSLEPRLAASEETATAEVGKPSEAGQASSASDKEESFVASLESLLAEEPGVSSTTASAKGDAGQEATSAGISGLSATLSNVPTPSRRSRSVSHDTNPSLLKRQRISGVRKAKRQSASKTASEGQSSLTAAPVGADLPVDRSKQESLAAASETSSDKDQKPSGESMEVEQQLVESPLVEAGEAKSLKMKLRMSMGALTKSLRSLGKVQAQVQTPDALTAAGSAADSKTMEVPKPVEVPKVQHSSRAKAATAPEAKDESPPDLSDNEEPINTDVHQSAPKRQKSLLDFFSRN